MSTAHRRTTALIYSLYNCFKRTSRSFFCSTFNIFLTVVLLVFANAFVNAQTFTFSGGVSNDNGTAESGVTVTAKSGGSIVESSTTSSSGRYKLELTYGKNYTIEIVKPGFSKRFYNVDLSNVTEENITGDDFATQNVNVLSEKPGLDLSTITTQPITSYTYAKKAGTLNKDAAQESASLKAEQNILTQKEKAETGGGVNKAELEKQFNEKIKVGDAAMTAKEYDKAQKAFLDAADFANKNKLDDAEAQTKLEAADNAKKQKDLADLTEKQENAAFLKVLDEAKKLEVKKDFLKAKEKLDEAKILKPDNKEVEDLLKKVNQALADKAIEDQLNKDFQQAMTDGNQLFENKDYENAIKKYEEAKKFKPTENEPLLKIQAAQNKWNDQKNEAQKLATFESFLLQANTLKDAAKYDEAIKKFEEAQLLLKDRPEPKVGIDFCKTKKKELEDLAKNEAEKAKRDADYAAAIKKAEDFFKADKYKEAIVEYESALKVKPEEQLPRTQIDAANLKINEIAGIEERKKQFEQLKKDGEKALNMKQMVEAKEKFTQANAILEGDPVVSAKLAEIDQWEKENAAALLKQEQFKELIKNAETALAAENFQEAKNLFTQASVLEPNDATIKPKLDLIEKRIKDQAADLAKKQQFDLLVQSANAKEAAKDSKGAIEDLNKAYELIKDAQVKAKIDQLQESSANEALAAKKKLEYDAEITKAETAKNAKDWEKARDYFLEAKKIDVAQAYPDQQIMLVNQEIAKIKGAAERFANFTSKFTEAEKIEQDKKYKEAELLFKEALTFADAELDLKKTNEKITELAKLLDKLDGEARKEQAFSESITAAQNFEKEDKLKEALEKYREAKSIKPEATEPLKKELEISTILEQRENEAKQKERFNTLMSEGEALFLAANFKEALKKYNDAKLVYPDNAEPQKKIDEVNKKIEELANDLKEQAYQKILVEADNKRIDGKLDDALKLYNEAQKERPNDPIPTAKIKEIQEEIDTNNKKAAELALKKSRYSELLKLAAEEFDKKELKKALNLYTDAQQVLPDEAVEANNKIEQINNLLANEEALKLAEEQRLAQIQGIIDNADLAFKEEKYDNALTLYNEAITLDPNNDVIKQKIKITEDRIVELEKDKFEKKIRDMLLVADKTFSERKYDESKVLYEELLELQPGNKKATEQIALIQRIKTPASDIADLPDLGAPSFYSILEGEALLSQADKQKEQLRLKKLRDQLTTMETKRLDQVGKESDEALEAWLNAKVIEKNQEQDPSKSNVEQWLIEQIVRDRLANMTEQEKIENILAYKDLVDLQAHIRVLAIQQVDGIKGNIKNPMLNEDELNAYLKTVANKGDDKKIKDLELLLQNESIIHQIHDLHSTDIDFSKALTTFNNILLTSLFYDLRNSTPEQLAARQAYLENAIASLNAYAQDINERLDKNYEKVTAQEAKVKEIYTNARTVENNDVNRSYENRQNTLEALRQFGDLINEQNTASTENQNKFQNSVVKRQTTNIDVYTAEMTKNYLKLHQQDQDLKMIFKFDSKDYELWENDIKNAYAELKELNRLVVKENDRITEEKQKSVYRNTKDINELVTEKSTKEKENHTKQNNAAKTLQDVDRGTSDKQQANLDKAKKNIQDNRALLDQLERKNVQFTDATANTLGQKFPEGVTEENFVTKDDDDIVVEVKTRRIVVVNGSGNVFMRYSNRYGVTYTKNSIAITEYQWVKETQNAKLQKYKIN